jgi:hypothetical protein
VGSRRRLIVLPILALALGGALGCRSKQKAPPPVPSAAPSADQLAKGEIPEGRERAFTLPLPLHSTVKARFGTSVHVASPHTHEELSNFVRSRVKDGKTSSGASETRFDDVVVSKDTSKTLSIQVRPSPIAGGEYRSQMVISDVTPLPEEPGTTDADRWRKAGMTPDGKLLDPKHMQ